MTTIIILLSLYLFINIIFTATLVIFSVKKYKATKAAGFKVKSTLLVLIGSTLMAILIFLIAAFPIIVIDSIKLRLKEQKKLVLDDHEYHLGHD